MDEKFSFALRKLALLGAVDDYVAISSRELGDTLGMSQQSASKRILELLDEKLIVRDLGARRQRIKLTPRGTEELKKEYNEYRMIFETTDHMTIHGVVASGLGEGGYYICQAGYMSQFQAKLGFAPFEGTLNVKVDEDDVGKLDYIGKSSGIVINGFSSEGRSFGNVIAYRAKIRNMDCAIVVPDRTHYVDTLEIICPFHLRRTLSLNDGDRVDVRINSRAGVSPRRMKPFRNFSRYFIADSKMALPSPVSLLYPLVQSAWVNLVMTLSGWGIMPSTFPAGLQIPAMSEGDPLGFHG